MHLIQNQDSVNKINTLEVDKSSIFIDKAKTGKIRPWQERKLIV